MIESQPFPLQSSRGKGWDSIIKRKGLGFNHQEGRVGIQSSRRKGWDSIIKREALGFNYQTVVQYKYIYVIVYGKKV
jgi:hypothetical protein